MRIKEQRSSRGAAAVEARAAAPVAAAAAAPFAAAAAAAPSAAPTAAVAAGVIRLPGYSAWLEDGRPKPLKVFDHHSGRAIAAYKSAAGAHVAIMAARDPAALDEALCAHGAPESPAKLAMPAQAAKAAVAQPGHEQVAAAHAVGLAIGRNKQRQHQPLPLPPPSSQQQQRGQQQPAAHGSAPRPRLGLKASLAAAGLSAVPSAAPALISPRAAAIQLMPRNAPAERPMAAPQLLADLKLGAMPAPPSWPPQQRQPQDFAPPPAQAGSPAMQADVHAAAVPLPAAPSASRPPATTAAGQDAEQGSSSGSSTEQPALKSLISRLLGGKRQVQQPGELVHMQQRPSATVLKQPAEGNAAACGGSLAPAGQLGMPAGVELAEAGSTEEQGVAPAKRRRLKTEATDDEEQQLRDRQAIAALFDSSSEEVEVPTVAQCTPAGQPSEEGELPLKRDQLWQPSEEGELPCKRDQLWPPMPPAAAAPAPSASTATAVAAGTGKPAVRQLSHEEQRVLAFFQAQPNQRATTAEFEAWASSVGLRVLCVVARSTLRQLGCLDPPTRLRKERGWLWSLAGSGGSAGRGGTSSSPSGSSSSPPDGTDTPTSSASLSSDSSGPAAGSSTIIGGKPSREPQQREPAEAAAVAEPQQPRRHRLAVEGAREPQQHGQQLPGAPIRTAAGAAHKQPPERIGLASHLPSAADKRAEPSAPAASAGHPASLAEAPAAADQTNAGVERHSAASELGAAAAAAVAAAGATGPACQLPAGSPLPPVAKHGPLCLPAAAPAGTGTGAAAASAGAAPIREPAKAAKRKPRPAGNRKRRRRAAPWESDSDAEDAVGGAEARATLRQHSSKHAGQALALPSEAAAAAFAAADAAASRAAAGHSGTSGAAGAASSLPSTSLDGQRSVEPDRPAALAVPSTDVLQQTAERWQQQARLHAERWTEEQMAYKPEAWLEDAEQIDAVVQAAAALQLLTQQQRPAAAVKARQLELARRQQRQELGGPGFEQPKVAQKAGGGEKAGKAAARPQKSSGHLKASVRDKQPASRAHPKPAQAAASLPRVQPTPEMLAMAARQLLAVSGQASSARQLPQPPAMQQVPLALAQASSHALLMQFQAWQAAAAALQMPQAAVAAPQPVRAVAGSPARQEAPRQTPAGASPRQLPAQLVGFPLLPQPAGAQHGMVPPMAALAAPMLLGQNAPAYLALLQQQMQALVMAQQAQAQQAQQQQQPGNALPLLLPMLGPLGAPAAAPQQHAAQQGQPQQAAGRQAQQLAAQGAPGEHAAGQHGEQ